MSMIWKAPIRIAVSTVTLVIGFHPVCSLVFGCQCSPLGFGGHETCIYAPWLSPKPVAVCPWCVMDTADLVGLSAVVVTGAWVCTTRLPRMGLVGVVLASATTTAGLLVLMGILTALVDGYVAGGVAQWLHEKCG